MSLVGNLRDLALSDIFEIVGLSRKSGVLHITHEEAGQSHIVFHHGDIVGAWSSRCPAILTEIFQQEKIVVPSLMTRFQKGSADPLADVQDFFAKSSLPSEKAYEISDAFIRRTLLQILEWKEGSFHFELMGADGHPDLKPEWALLSGGINPAYIGLESARIKDETSAEPVEAFVPSEQAEQLSDTQTGDGLVDLATELNDQFERSQEFLDEKALSPGLSMLKNMLQELHHPNIHTYITLLVLRYASHLFNRSILFDVQDSALVALGEFGIASNKDDSARLVREIRIPRTEASTLVRAVMEHLPTKTKMDPSNARDAAFLTKLGGGIPREIFLGPIVSGQRCVGLLYGDQLPNLQDVGDTEAFEIFLSVAGFALEKLRLERKQKK